MGGSMSILAICVNPMSGKDVRRLAAKASDITPKNKQDIVARIVIGANATGIERILLNAEPFRIAEQAISELRLSAKIELIRTPIEHTAKDTKVAVEAFLQAGAKTIVSLGGDGTNRAIVNALSAKQAEDVQLVPLSAGTNNAFPSLAEPTTAGMVATLAAQGVLDPLRRRCKVIHITLPNGQVDFGLIDATVLTNDRVGNLLPFETNKLKTLLLTQANPATVGMAAIGGLLEVSLADDDSGLLIELGGESEGFDLLAPVSPGLFEPVKVRHFEKVSLGQEITLSGEGVLALDGDRDHTLKPEMAIKAEIRRDGPWVFDTNQAIQQIVRQGGLRLAKNRLLR